MLNLDAGNWGGIRNVRPKANSPPLATFGVRKSFYRQKEGALHAETEQPSQTVTFTSDISDLTSVILVV